MHVIFISACQKRAIRRSRAILDSYALRAGERCWMSPMTTEGLQEVRAALARNATRQTSVACYQNDGRRRMKLLWIMGARGRFGPEGHFPAGYRRITTPVRVSEWVRHAGLAARLAGLLHDLGKYSLKFQEKLRGKAELADAVRHEWISLKLWQAVRSGMDLEDGMGERVYKTPRNVHRRTGDLQRLALWPCFGTGMCGCACFHTSWPVLLASALPGRQARTGKPALPA